MSEERSAEARTLQALSKAEDPTRLYTAAKAFEEMCACFCIDRTPSERLFAQLEQARQAMRDYEKYKEESAKYHEKYRGKYWKEGKP